MALLVALGVVLHRLEALLPLPSPWIKPGLANIMTLLALVHFGMRDAFLVTVVRVILASLFAGTFLGPSFLLSLAGGLVATACMGLVFNQGRTWFSMLGISLVGAWAHVTTIFLCVGLFFIQAKSFLALLPFFLIFSLVSGCLTGVVANSLMARLPESGGRL